jgi:2-dehydropantoate 2-reductase
VSRYVIVGAGGVGSALAAGLRDAGLEVELVSRHGAPRFTHAGRTRTLAVVADVDVRRDDVLVLAVKTQDIHAALAQWAWRGAETVVTVQNGLEAERAAARYFPHVVGGVTLTAATHVTPGEIVVHNAPRLGQIILGGSPRAEAIAADLRAANWLAQNVPDIERWKAWKLTRAVEFASDLFEGDVTELRAALTREAEIVLAAVGYGFADPERELTYDPSEAAVPPDYGPRSTHQSVLRGVPTEVDFLNGEIVRLARRHRLAAPVNAAVQRVLGERPGTHHVGEVLTGVPA